jgi:uncharacterized UPF0160 family protein
MVNQTTIITFTKKYITILTLVLSSSSRFALAFKAPVLFRGKRALVTQTARISTFQTPTIKAPFARTAISKSCLSIMSATTINTNNDSRNPHKRTKFSSNNLFPQSTKVIGTHSGTFQADEALGVWILRQTSTYYQSKVIRTRDENVYSNEADIVIDVGGVYDHDLKRYDHHQRDYDQRFDDKVKIVVDKDGDEVKVSEKNTPRITKLSASGLVYRHYGKEVISNLYPTLSTKELDLVYTKMYNSFMEAIDAIDTGVEPLSKECANQGIELQYWDSTGLSSRVSRLNPRWNDDDENSPDTRFETASALCGEDFMSVLSSIVESSLPARAFVENALTQRFDIDPSGQIIKFPSGGLPWKSHLYELEKEYKLFQDKELIKFVLYTDQGGMWRIQAVTVQGQAFENRLSLPEKWRGVRDADLEQIAGIDGCTFCHAAGFIGGNKSFEGALEMARVALEQGGVSEE